MTYVLHSFDPTEHQKRFNSLPINLKKRILFLPEDTIIDQNYKDPSLSKSQNHKNMIQKLENFVQKPTQELDPENDQWIWLGTYGGQNNSPIYRDKSLIRTLYKHFIQPDLPDNRRLTTFSTTSIYDVNPYKISTSLSPLGSSRYTMNLRKALNKELPQTGFEGSKLSRVQVSPLDQNSFEYCDLFTCLHESGFIEMPHSPDNKEMAIQYLIQEGFNPIHSKQMVEEKMK